MTSDLKQPKRKRQKAGVNLESSYSSLCRSLSRVTSLHFFPRRGRDGGGLDWLLSLLDPVLRAELSPRPTHRTQCSVRVSETESHYPSRRETFTVSHVSLTARGTRTALRPTPYGVCPIMDAPQSIPTGHVCSLLHSCSTPLRRPALHITWVPTPPRHHGPQAGCPSASHIKRSPTGPGTLPPQYPSHLSLLHTPSIDAT